MSQYLLLSLIGLGALLLAAACGPASIPVPTAAPTEPLSTAPPEPSATASLSTSSPEPSPPPAATGGANADVLQVRAVESADGSWTFHVTVKHPDSGWEDYADGWDVLTPGGAVLRPDPESPFTRLLLHPHENEQPFTRSQSGIVIPAGLTQVRVRAHDLVDGFGGREVLVDLTEDSGEDFEVERSE